MRKGEILSRRWSDIDLDSGNPCIYVRQTKNDEPKRIQLPDMAQHCQHPGSICRHWWVRSRAFPIQPYKESGFPHGKDLSPEELVKAAVNDPAEVDRALKISQVKKTPAEIRAAGSLGQSAEAGRGWLRVFVEQAWDVLEPEVLAPQALLPHGGNAEGSTLRLSLGCILAEQLGIQLRRVGSGKRLTFGTGEQRLS